MVYKMKFNRNLTIYTILLIVICILLVSQASAADFNGTSLSDLDESIKTSTDGNIELTKDLNFTNVGSIDASNIVIDGNGHSMVLSPKQNSVFMNVSGECTLKNMIISGGRLYSSYEINSYIKVNYDSKLILDNVTFTNMYFGDSPENGVIYNKGDILVQNSVFTNIYGYRAFFYNEENTALTIENSTFEDNHCSLSCGRCILNINNSFFNNVECYNSFIINDYSSIYSSLFVNIKSKDFINPYGINIMGNFMNNVFFGVKDIFQENLIYSSKFSVKNSYFGTNDPIGDGLFTYDDFNIDDNIKLEFVLNPEDDNDYLMVGREIPVEIKLIGDTSKLPSFTLNLSSDSNLEISKDSITFNKGNSDTIYITPREKGNGSIILDCNLNKINPSFNYSAYGDLRNYNMTLYSKDKISHSDDLDVSIELRDDDFNPITGSVAFYINGVYYDDVMINEGIGSISLSKLSVGDSNVLNAVFYHKSYNYDDANVSKIISVEKGNLNFQYDDLTITEGQDATITVTNIPDDLTSSIVISLSNLGGQVAYSNGVASQSFSNLGIGTYSVSIFTAGDNNYNMFDDVAIIYVVKNNVNPDGGSDTPVNPDSGDGTADNSSGNSGNSSGDLTNPDVPDVPDNQGAGSDSTGNQTVDSDPENPDPTIPDSPSTPDTPDTPSTPDAPDSPSTPDNPGADSEPVNPEPGVDSNPDVPMNPDAPDITDTSKSPESDSGSGSDNSDAFEDNSDVPTVPDTPDVPDAPDVPDVPYVPDIPNNGDLDIDPSDYYKPYEPQNNPSDGSHAGSNKDSNPVSDSNAGDSPSNTPSSNYNSQNPVSAQTDTDNSQVIGTTTTDSSNSADSSSASSSEAQSSSSSSAGTDGDALDVSKAYSIEEIVNKVINNELTYEIFVLIAIVLLLLVIGYYRKNKEEY